MGTTANLSPAISGGPSEFALLALGVHSMVTLLLVSYCGMRLVRRCKECLGNGAAVGSAATSVGKFVTPTLKLAFVKLGGGTRGLVASNDAIVGPSTAAAFATRIRSSLVFIPSDMGNNDGDITGDGMRRGKEEQH